MQRDISTHSLPSHFQWKPEPRVRHRIGRRSQFGVAASVWPPSVEISTLRTAPPPDHARPLIS